MDMPAPLFVGLLILAGSAGGWLASKVKLPALFGQVMAGVLLGQTVAGETLHFN